jgi:hypothetical protein
VNKKGLAVSAAGGMLANVAHLLPLLARTEMRLACLQDDLLSTGAAPFRGSTMELLCGGLGPLRESGHAGDDALPRVYRMLRGYCTPDEAVLAARAFLAPETLAEGAPGRGGSSCSSSSRRRKKKRGTTPLPVAAAEMPARITADTVLERVLRRKSLWRSCSRATAAGIEEEAAGDLAASVPDLATEGSDEERALALRRLLLNEITLERAADAQRRLLAAHKDFNVAAVFSTVSSYDDAVGVQSARAPAAAGGFAGQRGRGRGRQRRLVTATAIVKFCADHGVPLKRWHVRALLSRYQRATMSQRVQQTLSGSNRGRRLGSARTVPAPAPAGLTYDEFTGMLLECRVEWQVSAVEWQKRICDDHRDAAGDNALESAVAEAALLHSGPDGTEIGSNVVRAHLKSKYLSSRVLLGGTLVGAES